MTSGIRRGAAAALLALAVAACSAPSASPDPATSGASASVTPSDSGEAPASPTQGPFDPAAVSQLFLPTGTARSAPPLVVLVPGGSWTSHDNSGFVPLAQTLADAGFVVVNTSYRAGNEGQIFPVPAQDVQCAIAYAARAATDAGVGGGPVVVVGHSAGGHLAALAAVSGTRLDAECSDPRPRIAGFVGLGGVYDTAAFEPYLTSFFGSPRQDNPALWASGDPIAYVAAGAAPKQLEVLLLAGEKDFDVPVTQAQAFDTALRKAKVPVTLTVVAGANHGDLITPDAAAAPIIAFTKSLTR